MLIQRMIMVKHRCTMLLKNDADVNSEDEEGRTPLHYAAMYGSLGAVKLLIQNGADINACDGDGKTPLDEAFEQRYWDIVDYISEIL